jgi:hypothetical protein
MPISETVAVWFIGHVLLYNANADAAAGMASVARDSANGAACERGSYSQSGLSASIHDTMRKSPLA